MHETRVCRGIVDTVERYAIANNAKRDYRLNTGREFSTASITVERYAPGEAAVPRACRAPRSLTPCKGPCRVGPSPGGFEPVTHTFTQRALCPYGIMGRSVYIKPRRRAAIQVARCLIVREVFQTWCLA